MRKLFPFIAILLIFQVSVAAENKYPVSEIPPSLLTGAHAVIRLSDTYIHFTAPGEATTSTKIVITILDSEGDDYATMVTSYSHFLTIKNFEANLYDKNGKKVKSLGNKDIEDRSSISSGTLYDDFRLRIATLSWNEFPYTVEFIINEEMNALIHTQQWAPVGEEYTSLQQATLTVETKPDLPFNYWSSEDNQPAITKDAKHELYTWQMKSIPPIRVEEMGPTKREQFPSVNITSLIYKIENNQALIKDWEDMSRYFYTINKGRDELNEDAVKEIKMHIVNCKNKKDSINAVYTYFKNSTRYISVQIGLGGWQCYDANYVYKYKLGDCKALSNYMKALLKAAGINSLQALVSGSYQPEFLQPDHVSNAFNHVILLVPCEKDTVWLECTDPLAPFGYMSDFTQNRYCLPLSEAGSGLIRIPLSSEFENAKKVFADLYLDSTGKLSGTVDIELTGTYSDHANRYFKNQSEQQIKDWMNENLHLHNGSITSAKLVKSGGDVPRTFVTCTYTLEQVFAPLSNRAFLKANIFDRMGKIPNLGTNRKFNMLNNFPFIVSDSIVYHLPSNFSLESYTKEEKKIESPAGEYSLQVNSQAEKHVLIVTRKHSLNAFNLDREKNDELRNYFSFIAGADASEFVLKR